MSMSAPFAAALKIPTFRASREELHALDRRHLAVGLLLTWLVGIGRWWEDPRAGLIQHLGLGSVIYVFALALFLWLVLWPLCPPHWSYFNVLTFVSLTSLPGILYALPVRHGLELQTAQTVRLWMLAIVAGWRVLLLVWYLGRGAGLAGFPRLIGAIFPLVIIIFALMALNLEKVVFSIMGDLGPEKRSVNDSAYAVLFLITVICFYAFFPLLVFYLIAAVYALRSKYKRVGKQQQQD